MEEGQKNIAPEQTTGENTAGVPAAEPKKKSKFPIAAVAAAAVAVVGVGIFAVTHLTAKDPKVVVAEAFMSLTEDSTNHPLEQIFGLKQMRENALTGNYEAEFDLTLSQLSAPDLEILSGGGLTVQEQTDHEAGNSWASVGLNYKGLQLGEIQAYYDDAVLQLAVPDFSSRVFQIDMGDGLKEQIANSPLLEMAGMSQEEKDVIAEYYAGYLNSITGEPLTMEEIWSRFKESGTAVSDFVGAVQAEKAGKETFRMDGKDVSCTGYNVTVSRDAMSDFITSFTDFILEDEELKDLVMTQIGASMELYSMEGDAAQDGYEEMAEGIREGVDQICAALTDLQMVVYVDGQGRMAAWDCDTSIAADGDETVISLELRPQGGTYLLQNMTGKLEIENGGETVLLDLNRSGSYENGLMENQVDMTFAVAEDSFTISWTDSYDSEESSWQFTANVATTEEPQLLTVEAQGQVPDFEKGTAISVDMDQMTVAVMGEEANLEGSYSYGPLESEPQSLSGDVMNIFTATEADWQAVMDEVTTSVTGLLMSMWMQAGA